MILRKHSKIFWKKKIQIHNFQTRNLSTIGANFNWYYQYNPYWVSMVILTCLPSSSWFHPTWWIVGCPFLTKITQTWIRTHDWRKLEEMRRQTSTRLNLLLCLWQVVVGHAINLAMTKTSYCTEKRKKIVVNSTHLSIF